jgi:membrane protein
MKQRSLSGSKSSLFANAFGLLKQTGQEFFEDKAPQLGAALAYYTVFSLAPLILVLLSIVGVIFRKDPAGAWDKLTQQMSYFLDPSAVQVVQNIAQQASQPSKSTMATIIGVALALFGASGVFGQLQDALNTIWGMKAKPSQGIFAFLRARFLSFAVVAGISFLLLVSLAVEALLKGFSHYVQSVLPAGIVVAVGVYLIFDFAVVVLLFAMIFKFLPDVSIQWRDVWDRRRDDCNFVWNRQMAAGLLPWQRCRRFGLRSSQFAHHIASLGLLLIANPAVRRRIHTSICAASGSRA